MPLSPEQTQIARLLYNLAVSRGLGPRRAREFVGASYEESGLRPGARNRASGAAGLFQLLSSGYVNRANQLGGVHNPRANALAILPDYVRYWQQHPNAAPGAAARDVERSGQGADFYSRHLSFFNQLGGGGSAVPPSASAPATAQEAVPDKRALLLQFLQAQHPHGSPLVSILQQQQAMQQPEPAQTLLAGNVTRAPRAAGGHAGINELFYDPLGGIKHGQQIGAIGHHSDHVHMALSNLRAQLAAEAHARQMGLHVGEEQNSDVHPVHVKGSYHYRNFPGSRYRQAADISGDARAMAAFYRWVAAHYGRHG